MCRGVVGTTEVKAWDCFRQLGTPMCSQLKRYLRIPLFMHTYNGRSCHVYQGNMLL